MVAVLETSGLASKLAFDAGALGFNCLRDACNGADCGVFTLCRFLGRVLLDVSTK